LIFVAAVNGPGYKPRNSIDTTPQNFDAIDREFESLRVRDKCREGMFLTSPAIQKKNLK